MNRFLKFQDQATAKSVLFNGETPRYKNIDVIGVIHKPTGVMLTDVDGTEYKEIAPIDGWHVNLFVLPDEDTDPLEPYSIIPNNPTRVWG